MQWSWLLLRYILPGIPGRILLTPLPLPDLAPLQSEKRSIPHLQMNFSLSVLPADGFDTFADTLDIVLLRYQKRNDHFPEILS